MSVFCAWVVRPTFQVSAWDVDGLDNADGTAAAATEVPTTGDVQMGVVQFLEEKATRQARADLASGDARFVRLKRA